MTTEVGRQRHASLHSLLTTHLVSDMADIVILYTDIPVEWMGPKTGCNDYQQLLCEWVDGHSAPHLAVRYVAMKPPQQQKRWITVVTNRPFPSSLPLASSSSLSSSITLTIEYPRTPASDTMAIGAFKLLLTSPTTSTTPTTTAVADRTAIEPQFNAVNDTEFMLIESPVEMSDGWLPASGRRFSQHFSRDVCDAECVNTITSNPLQQSFPPIGRSGDLIRLGYERNTSIFTIEACAAAAYASSNSGEAGFVEVARFRDKDFAFGYGLFPAVSLCGDRECVRIIDWQ